MTPTFALKNAPGNGLSGRFRLLPPERRTKMSGWAQDLFAGVDPGAMSQLEQAIEQTLTNVASAYDALNSLSSQLDTLATQQQQVQSQFGQSNPSDNTNSATIASDPLLLAQANINIAGARIAGIDLQFTQMSQMYTEMAQNLTSGGFTQQATGVQNAANQMQNWLSQAQSQIYPRLAAAQTYRQTLESQFQQALQAVGLTENTDDDQPGYFDALAQVLQPLTASDTTSDASGQAGALAGRRRREGLGDPASIALAIVGLLKVIAIVAGVIAALVAIVSVVQAIWGAQTQAMSAVAQLEQRKTLRAQQVAAGQLTQAQADQMNTQDAQDTMNGIQQAAQAAAAGNAGLTQILTYGAIAVGGVLGIGILMKVMDIG